MTTALDGISLSAAPNLSAGALAWAEGSARREDETTKLSQSLRTPVTRWSVSMAMPRRAASLSSASSTVRDLFESGNSLPSSSSCKRTPSSSKNAAARLAGNARRTFRTTRGEPPQKSRSVTSRLVTLQRDPPLTRILAPMRRAPSRHRTRRCGAARAAKIAAASPAAPAPTTTTSVCEDKCFVWELGSGSWEFRIPEMAETATTQPTLQSTRYGDIIGGITTFFTMAYIVVVNPSILSTPGTGMPFTGAMTATVLIAFSMTLLMGLYARLPFAVAPGMGLNAFFAFTIVLQQQVPWQTALGMVFWAGVLFLLVSVTPLREAIALAIPGGLRLAAAAGIGLLLTFIGFRNAGLIEGDPATLLRLGTLDHRTAFLLVGVLVAVMLQRRNNPLA